MNDGRLCANMIDHFTPPAFFKTVRGMEHEQLFTEFNVSAARNLSLSSEVRMRAEYNILEKRKWRSLAEEKNTLLEAKDKEIEDLKSQLLRAREDSAEVTQLRAQVSGLEATENSLRGEVASAKGHNILLEQEFPEPSLVDQVHELEISSADLREKLEMYEGLLKRVSIYPLPPPNVLAGEDGYNSWDEASCGKVQLKIQMSTWKALVILLVCYRERIAGGSLAQGLSMATVGGLTDLEAYIPSAEDDFNSAIRELRDLNFPLLQELSNKKDASTWDIMDLLRLDDAVAKTLGMTDLQPDASQLMVPVHHKQDRVIIGSQALSVALDICRGRVEKMERNLIERLPFLKDIRISRMWLPENANLRLRESEGKIDASAGDGLTFSQLDDEARDAVL
ncbi:hypothetical protein Tco_0414682 [Tanacetum coccineum]